MDPWGTLHNMPKISETEFFKFTESLLFGGLDWNHLMLWNTWLPHEHVIVNTIKFSLKVSQDHISQ